jgi:hypothetical protein
MQIELNPRTPVSREILLWGIAFVFVLTLFCSAECNAGEENPHIVKEGTTIRLQWDTADADLAAIMSVPNHCCDMFNLPRRSSFSQVVRMLDQTKSLIDPF